MSAVRCHGLTKHYGEVTALNNLDLVVEEKSVFGFLGPNGAGKTTTVKLLTGLSLPSAGISRGCYTVSVWDRNAVWPRQSWVARA